MRILEAFALHNVGMSYARMGNLDEGISCQRHAARIADETSAARLRIHTRSYEAILLVWRGAPGDLGAADTLARFACEETRSVPALYTTSLFIFARVQLVRRFAEEAVQLGREVLERVAAMPVEEWEELMRLTLVEAHYAAGQVAEGDAALDAAFRVVEAHAMAIRRPEQRHAFLTRLEEVRRITDLARERLGRTIGELPAG
jgi:hypothetical protein